MVEGEKEKQNKKKPRESSQLWVFVNLFFFFSSPTPSLLSPWRAVSLWLDCVCLCHIPAGRGQAGEAFTQHDPGRWWGSERRDSGGLPGDEPHNAGNNAWDGRKWRLCVCSCDETHFCTSHEKSDFPGRLWARRQHCENERVAVFPLLSRLKGIEVCLGNGQGYTHLSVRADARHTSADPPPLPSLTCLHVNSICAARRRDRNTAAQDGRRTRRTHVCLWFAAFWKPLGAVYHMCLIQTTLIPCLSVRLHSSSGSQANQNVIEEEGSGFSSYLWRLLKCKDFLLLDCLITIWMFSTIIQNISGNMRWAFFIIGSQ